MPEIFVWLALPVFLLGGFFCICNFKLFLDWVLFRLRKLPAESHKHISAIPILGSLLVYLVLRPLEDVPFVPQIGYVLIAIDMGGIHWMVFGIFYQGVLAVWRRLR